MLDSEWKRNPVKNKYLLYSTVKKKINSGSYQRLSIKDPHCGYEVSICLHEEFVTKKLECGMFDQRNLWGITLRH